MKELKMKNCKTCGKELDKSTKVCPACGKDQRNFFKKHKILTAVLAVIVIAFAFGSSNDNSTETSKVTPTNNTTTEEKVAKYEFTQEPEMVHENYTNKIVGIIKNNTSNDKSYIQVTFTLYDADGNNIGTAIDNTNNLKADGTWKFEAIILEDNVATFELDEVSGF